MSVVFLIISMNAVLSIFSPTKYFLYRLNDSSAFRFQTSGSQTLPASEHLDGFDNSDCWTSIPKVSNLVTWGGAREFAFPINSQVILMLLVQHLGNHCSRNKQN